jgi:beta-xylosidase
VAVFKSNASTWMVGTGHSRRFNFELAGLPQRVRLKSSLVDREHGWAEHAWRQMGAPTWPNARQLDQLRHEQDPACSTRTADTVEGRLSINETVGDLGMLLLEIESA